MSKHNSLDIGAVKDIKLSDRTWMAHNFLLPGDVVDKKNNGLAFLTKFSSAMGKVWDTGLGGHAAINCPPQNNPLADIRSSFLTVDDTEKSGFFFRGGDYSHGLGRFFSESIDDHMETVTFQFGHLRYQGVLPFFTNFYNAEQAQFAKTGHLPSIWFMAGQALGVAAQVAALVLGGPALSMLVCAGAFVRFFLNRPSSGYYYIKPSPYAYLRRAQTILNQMTVYMKLTAVGGQSGKIFEEKFDHSIPDTGQGFIEYAHSQMPDIFNKYGGIDIVKVMLRGVRLDKLRREKAMNFMDKINNRTTAEAVKNHLMARYQDDANATMEAYEELYFKSHFGNPDYMQYDPFQAIVEDAIQKGVSDGGSIPEAPKPETDTDQAIASESNGINDQISNYMETATPDRMRASWWKSDTSSADGGTGNAVDSTTTLEKVVNVLTPFTDGNERWSLVGGWGEAAETAKDIAKKGGDFITFKVDPIGSVSESFSNTLGEAEISSKINSTSSSMASARFSFSGGNTGVDVVDGVFNAVGDFLKGALAGVHLDGLLALAGSAHVEIPKHYQSSSADFQNHTFNIELRSPYGDRFSQFVNLHVPLAMLLAGALPLSTGVQSYTAPFYCLVYSRGRCMIRNGMITSISITRGVGNLGWNKRMEPLGIDVSIQVTDAAQVMHAPIDSGWRLFKPWRVIIDDDSAFKDYMSTLASMSLVDMTDMVRKAGINWTKWKMEVGSMFSASHVGLAAGDTWVGRTLAELSRVATGAPSLVQIEGGLSPREILRGG